MCPGGNPARFGTFMALILLLGFERGDGMDLGCRRKTGTSVKRLLQEKKGSETQTML